LPLQRKAPQVTAKEILTEVVDMELLLLPLVDTPIMHTVLLCLLIVLLLPMELAQKVHMVGILWRPPDMITMPPPHMEITEEEGEEGVVGLQEPILIIEEIADPDHTE
jgi:hypothetical protein